MRLMSSTIVDLGFQLGLSKTGKQICPPSYTCICWKSLGKLILGACIGQFTGKVIYTGITIPSHTVPILPLIHSTQKSSFNNPSYSQSVIMILGCCLNSSSYENILCSRISLFCILFKNLIIIITISLTYMQAQQQQEIAGRIKWPNIHKSIKHRDNGLYAVEDIEPMTLLIQIESKYCIYEDTLPQIFKKLDSIQENDKVTLYVLLLQNLRDKQSIDSRIAEWLSSHTAGFIGFSEKLMQSVNDEQLLIQYMATKRHYQEQSKHLYSNKTLMNILKKFCNIGNETQFREKFIKAIQFRNTRSFGHTKQALLIPFMDYMNYDPSQNTAKLNLITYDNQEQYYKVVLNEQFSQMELEQDQGNNQNGSSDSDQQLDLPPVKKCLGLINTFKILKDEELNFDYGGLSNLNLLKTYGYAVRANPKDYLKLYISNYPKQNMISFSEVERCTTKFKIYPKLLNKKMIEHWIKIHNTNTIQTIQLLIKQMQSTIYPMSHYTFEKMNQFDGYNYISIYKEEQRNIFYQQIKLLTQCYKQLKIQNQIN